MVSMLLCPCISSSSASVITLFCSSVHYGQRLVSIYWQNNLIFLLPMALLQWTLISKRNTIISCGHFHRHIGLHASPQTFLSAIFHSWCIQTIKQQNKPTETAYELVYTSIIQPLLPQNEMPGQLHCSKHCHLGHFLSFPQSLLDQSLQYSIFHLPPHVIYKPANLRLFSSSFS